jgi:PAS domain S-box-containing protein
LKLYVAGVAVAAIALATVAGAHDGTSLGDNLVITALVCAMLVQAQLLRVRFEYRSHHADYNFFETAIAVAIIGFTPLDVAILATVATVIVMALHRIPLLKSTFNVAQWICAGVLGSLAFHWLGGRTGQPHGQTFAALIAGLTVTLLVNQALMALVLRLTSEQRSNSSFRGLAKSVVASRLVIHAASLSLGTLLAAAYCWAPWILAVTFLPLALLHVASRAHAEARADRARLAGLQRATHALSVAHTSEEAFSALLREVRTSFEVTTVELWLVHDGVPQQVAADPPSVPQPAPSAEAAQRLMTRYLRQGRDTPTRLSLAADDTASKDMAAYGHQDGLFVPLRSQQADLGMLCLFDRVGMEGFEEGELAVITALAAELVGYLERATLVGQLLGEQTKMARIVDQTSDGIVTLSEDGVIHTWNNALESVTGYAASEMVGTSHIGLLRARDEAGADVWLESWTTLDHLPERLQIRAASGESHWLSCSFTRAGGGEDGEQSLIVVARDVTAAHELERLKDDFVAVVSHELRTPLVPIKGWASMLLQRGDRMTAEQRRDALESIQAQAQRLERLVLNILDASRIEGGLEASTQAVDVSLVAARVVDEMLPSAATHAIRLHGATRPLVAFGQAVWVERALANLLANAVKYTPAESTVDITLAQEGAEVVIRVSDEGPGIPSGWSERIFERFERVPESSTQTGTGLGLYITRQLVSAMGGRVDVEKSATTGTVFCMRLRASSVQVPVPRNGQVTSDRETARIKSA